MGQLCFQYDTYKPILATNVKFQYRWTDLTEYGLQYQRHTALYDTSIFNALVAITRVVAGASHFSDGVFLKKTTLNKCRYDDIISNFASLEHSNTFTVNHPIVKEVESNTYYDYNQLNLPAENKTIDNIINFNVSKGINNTDNTALNSIPIPDGKNHVNYFDHPMSLQWVSKGDYLWINLFDIILAYSPDKIVNYLTNSLDYNVISPVKELIQNDDVFLFKGPLSILPINNILLKSAYPNIITLQQEELLKELRPHHMSICSLKYNVESKYPNVLSIFSKPELNVKSRYLNNTHVFKELSPWRLNRDMYLNLYQILGYKNNPNFSIYDNFNTFRSNDEFNFIDNLYTLFGLREDREMEIYKELGNAFRDDKSFDFPRKDITGEKFIKYNALAAIYSAIKGKQCGYVFDLYSAYAHNKLIEAFRDTFVNNDKKYVYIDKNALWAFKSQLRGILNETEDITDAPNNVALFNQLFSNKIGISPSLFKDEWGMKGGKKVVELSLDDFSITERHNVVVIGDRQPIQANKFINVNKYQDIYASHKLQKDAFIVTNKDMFVKHYGKNVFLAKSLWFSTDRLKLLRLFNQLLQINPDKNLNVYIERENEFVYKQALPGGALFDSINQVWTNKSGNPVTSDEKTEVTLSVYKGKDASTFTDKEILFVCNKPAPSFIADIATWVTSNRKSMLLDKTGVDIEKLKRDIRFEFKKDIFCEKVDRYAYYYELDAWSFKGSKDITLFCHWDYMPDKIHKDLEIFDIAYPSIIFDKADKSMEIKDVTTTFIKNTISIMVSTKIPPNVWERVAGFIVSVSKTSKGLMDSEIEEFVYKKIKSGTVQDSSCSSVIRLPIESLFFNDFLWIDKTNKNVLIEYINNGIVKGKIYAMTHEDIPWVFKDKRRTMIESITPITKNKKYVMVNIEDLWFKDSSRTAMTLDAVFLQKQSVAVDISSQITGADSILEDVNIFNQYWVEKPSNLCYYSYGDWFKTYGHDINDFIDEWVTANSKELILHLGATFGDMNNAKGRYYEDYIFGNTLFKEGQIAAEIQWLQATRKECGVEPNDFGNWAFVYETPDPFERTFGMDELLLPENDFKYENFKDLIFDSYYMRPRNPVKELSDTQWIAKYPVKHPIPEWSNIAIDYDASAIDWENYYGIETSIMRDMFLKFYRIWQVKMFEFSTMTMQQSVKRMLEYIWTWIPTYYPIDKLEEAYRVFKLIRWFGESAILNNSQYIISFEYDNGGMKMKQDLTTGKKTWGIYGIETNLKDCDPTSTNDSMFLDKKQYVIRNNPAYVGTSAAWVEFTFIAKRNTSVSFMLMNTIGSVNIYVDGSLKETKSKTGKVVIPIRYTGDEVTVRIEKDKANNLNNQFMIGALTIPEQDFKELDVQFDPQLRAGNKPLDEIARKLIAYATLHDDRNRAWEHALKANVGVSETFKQMVHYWNDHHANKIKGKRLTIKQV